jgi:ABC-type uncharacterized transport system substrate-binding protein
LTTLGNDELRFARLASGPFRLENMTNLLRPLGGLVALMLLLAIATPAAAHPHVFVDARAEVLFDAQGHITHVRHIWQFDRAFSAFAVQGLDKNGDGKLSMDELAPLAKVNVESLKEYGFFTTLTIGKERVKFKFTDQYFLRIYNGRLTLYYQLPLATPAAPAAEMTLEVYDPEYFVAFTFVKDGPIILDKAPKGCSGEYHPPRELDAAMMAQLSAIPKEQHDLPPALKDAALGLANLIVIKCPP